MENSLHQHSSRLNVTFSRLPLCSPLYTTHWSMCWEKYSTGPCCLWCNAVIMINYRTVIRTILQPHTPTKGSYTALQTPVFLIWCSIEGFPEFILQFTMSNRYLLVATKQQTWSLATLPLSLRRALAPLQSTSNATKWILTAVFAWVVKEQGLATTCLLMCWKVSQKHQARVYSQRTLLVLRKNQNTIFI